MTMSHLSSLLSFSLKPNIILWIIVNFKILPKFLICLMDTHDTFNLEKVHLLNDKQDPQIGAPIKVLSYHDFVFSSNKMM